MGLELVFPQMEGILSGVWPVGAENPPPTLKKLFFRGLNDIKRYSGVAENVSVLHKADLEGPERPAAWIRSVPLFSDQYLNAKTPPEPPNLAQIDNSDADAEAFA